MEKYKITRMDNHNCVDAYEEHFEVNGKKVKMEFDQYGHAFTDDDDIAGFYLKRNFPNSVPNGSLPRYWVDSFKDGKWTRVN